MDLHLHALDPIRSGEIPGHVPSDGISFGHTSDDVDGVLCSDDARIEAVAKPLSQDPRYFCGSESVLQFSLFRWIGLRLKLTEDKIPLLVTAIGDTG